MTPTAELIRNKREELDLTQKQFAQMLRLGANGDRTVRRWENSETAPADIYVHTIANLTPQPPFAQDVNDKHAFTFIDLFAGIGGDASRFFAGRRIMRVCFGVG